MIFEEARLSRDKQDRSQRRHALLRAALHAFADMFEPIRFAVLDNITAINAQASMLRGVRSVNLCAGLAYHPLAGRDALVFALLHETGHHLSSGCRMRWFAEMACDCAADRWAITEGRDTAARNGCGFILVRALREIDEIIGAPAGTRVRNASSARCPALDWRKRKRQLETETIPALRSCAAI
jgi:hypothetical protein